MKKIKTRCVYTLGEHDDKGTLKIKLTNNVEIERIRSLNGDKIHITFDNVDIVMPVDDFHKLLFGF